MVSFCRGPNSTVRAGAKTSAAFNHLSSIIKNSWVEMLHFLGPVTRAMFSFSTAVDAYSMVQLKEPIFVSQSSTCMTATMGEGGAKHYG